MTPPENKIQTRLRELPLDKLEKLEKLGEMLSELRGGNVSDV